MRPTFPKPSHENALLALLPDTIPNWTILSPIAQSYGCDANKVLGEFHQQEKMLLMERILAAVNGLRKTPAKAKYTKKPADQPLRTLKVPSFVLALMLRPCEARGVHARRRTMNRWTVMFKEKAGTL